MNEEEFNYPNPIYTDIACQRGQIVLEIARYGDSIKNKEFRTTLLEMMARLTMTVVPPAPKAGQITVFQGGKTDDRGPYAKDNANTEDNTDA